ncbi:MAG: thioredoxin-like domain-containing protein [Bacteroidota bacterium]
MLKFKIALFLVCWMCFLSVAYSQLNYNIKFKISGLKDTTCLIAYYYSNGTYIKDTLKVDHSGRCSYKSDSLPRGLYALVITDKNYFDFVVNNDHKFSIETTVNSPSTHMVFKNSPENELFLGYLLKTHEKFDQMHELETRIKPYTKKDSAVIYASRQDSITAAKRKQDTLACYSKKVDSINKVLINYRLSIVKEHPESFTALMINTMKEPEIPEIPVLSNGRKDSTFAYHYYKSHYWDDCTFTDDRVLRTPVFHNKLKKYFDEIVIQDTDTIMREADLLIEKSRPNKEMFKYLVWFTTYHYENSEIMGFDKIFVHVVDKYYVTGQTSWISKDINEKVIKKANKLRPILIGEKAPNMVMQDTTLQLASLYNTKAKFLMILFWDPDCGHCQKEIPVIKDFYDLNKAKYGLEIFAVCTDSTLVKWKKGIKKFKMDWINVDGPRTVTGDFHASYDIISTPVIYLLDENKKIIAKHLSAEKIGLFLDNYIKSLKRKEKH